MSSFRKWLENLEGNRFNHMKDIILNFFNLDPQNGLSQSLQDLNVQMFQSKLQGLGVFTELPTQTQQQALGVLAARQGTVGDLIRVLSTPAM